MEIAVANLPGDDLGVAKDYYGKLGFKVIFEATEDGKSGLVGFQRGGMRLNIDCPMEGHGRGAVVVFEVESADAYYEEWRDKVRIKRPPKDEHWGARTFDLIDPFDNTIFVLSPLESG